MPTDGTVYRMGMDGIHPEYRSRATDITFACPECGAELETDTKATDVACHSCASTFIFRGCQGCRAISMVPPSMQNWTCTECDLPNVEPSGGTSFTAGEYVEDLGYDHAQHVQGAGPVSSAAAELSGVELSTVLVGGNDVEDFSIDCPTCGREIDTTPEQTSVVCAACGTPYTFRACSKCGGILAIANSETSWECGYCHALGRPGTAEKAVTAEEFAEDMGNRYFAEQDAGSVDEPS